MASKKKRGGKAPAKKRAKAKPKAKAKAKAGARKAKRAPARKRKAVAVAKPRSKKAAVTKPLEESSSFPLIIDEVLEEPLLDASTILRVKDGVARAQRGGDEDELKQFSDPSIVIEAQTRNPRREADDTDESVTHLPELFKAEARLQKARAADSASEERRDGSLFGRLGSDSSKDDDED